MPDDDQPPPDDTRREIYERMYRIVKVDETMRGLIMKGVVSVIYYSPSGQEAIPAAMSASTASSRRAWSR